MILTCANFMLPKLLNSISVYNSQNGVGVFIRRLTEILREETMPPIGS